MIEEDKHEDNGDNKNLWCIKAKLVLYWVNKFSHLYCIHPGFTTSIDEIMTLFKGHSNMTHIMKCKPIPEDYKFYSVCCTQSGWCCFIVLDGKENNNNKKEIAKSVTWMVHHLPDRLNKLYIVCMDNYFTLVKTMISTKKCVMLVWGQQGVDNDSHLLNLLKESRMYNIMLCIR